MLFSFVIHKIKLPTNEGWCQVNYLPAARGTLFEKTAP
jgi:hypothetical protein